MLTATIALIGGLALLAWGATRLVDGSAAAARHLGVPPLLIGMVIIGFGTSTPELAVSALAAAQGTPGLAIGNAVGSNLSNLTLILGLSALLQPITLNSRALRGETANLALVTVLAGILAGDGTVSRLDASLLLLALVAVTARNVRQGLRLRTDVLAGETAERLSETRLTLGRSLLWTAGGFVMVLASSWLIVWGATGIARALGLSELFIGLSILAIGTSLPELAAAMSAAWKGEDDLALGNVIGSNVFNTTAVIGLAGAIRPLPVPTEILARGLPVVGALTLWLLAMTLLSRGEGRIGRATGGALVLLYMGYLMNLLRSPG